MATPRVTRTCEPRRSTARGAGNPFEQRDIHEVLWPPGGPLCAWDNAVAESFFATLKTELVYTFTTAESA
jgi:hypothetical protein